MQVRQICLSRSPTSESLVELRDIAPQLVLVFGAVSLLEAGELHTTLRTAFPAAELAGCTTAGEISTQGACDDHVVVTALHFDRPGFKVVVTDLQDMADSHAAGLRLADQLRSDILHHVIVLGQGVHINGSALTEGLQSALPSGVTVSGGLAGDGGAFKQTFTLSSNAVSQRQLVAIGFHAPTTRLAHGCFHGWKPFGPARRVTRACGNILYELDGKSALDVYRRYLGDHARNLPGSGLLFPFEMLGNEKDEAGLIRTILGIDEDQGSLILAGDIAEQGYLKLMHASTDSLVDGAQSAAEMAVLQHTAQDVSLAILVSCVGRKLVMGARVDEEVEVVSDVLGKHACLTGFYSNGEISPVADTSSSRLHNQTMTITHLSETLA